MINYNLLKNNQRIINSLYRQNAIASSQSSSYTNVPYYLFNNIIKSITYIPININNNISSRSSSIRSYSTTTINNNIYFNRQKSLYSLNLDEIDSPSSNPQQSQLPTEQLGSHYTNNPIYVEIQAIKQLYEANNYSDADKRLKEFLNNKQLLDNAKFNKSKYIGHLFAWIVKAKPFKVVHVIDDFLEFFLSIRDHMWLARIIEQYTWQNITKINDNLLDKITEYIFTRMHTEPKILHLFLRSDISQHTLFTAFKQRTTNPNLVAAIKKMDLATLPSLPALIVYNEAMSHVDPKSGSKSSKEIYETHDELFGYLRHLVWRAPSAVGILENVVGIYLKLDCYHYALDWYSRGANIISHRAYTPFVAYHKLRGDEELSRHWAAISTTPTGEVAAMRSFLSHSIDPMMQGESFRKQAAIRRGGYGAIKNDNELASYLEKADIEKIIEKLQTHHFLNKEVPRDQLLTRCSIAIYESVPEHYASFLKLVPSRLIPVFSNPRFFSETLQSDLMSGITMLPRRAAVGNVGPFNDILINLVSEKRYTLLIRVLAARLEDRNGKSLILQTRTLDAIASNLLANIDTDQELQQLAPTILSLLPQQHQSLPLNNLKLSLMIQRSEYPLANELFQTMEEKDQLSFQLAAQLLLAKHNQNYSSNLTTGQSTSTPPTAQTIKEISLEEFDQFFGIERKYNSTTATPTNDLTQQQYAIVFKLIYQANQTRLLKEYFESLMVENTLQTTNSLSQDLILLIMRVLEGQPALRCRFFKSVMDLKKMTSITPAIQILIKGDNEIIKDPHIELLLTSYSSKPPPKPLLYRPPSKPPPTNKSEFSEETIISFLRKRFNLKIN